jgi:hypothetical protein
MATAKQSEVTWVKKGDMVNGKKATRGYLALKSDKGKAFSGSVTGVAKGSTTTRNGTAQYSGGRNVYKVAERRSAKKSGGTVSTSSSSSYAKPKNSSYVIPSKTQQAKTGSYTPGSTVSSAERLRNINVAKKSAITVNNTPKSNLNAIEQALIRLKVKAKNAAEKKSRTAAEQRQLEADKKRIAQLTAQLKGVK